MANAGDICEAALRKSGVLGDGQSANAGDLNNALADFGDMLALWNEKRWLVWNLLDFAFTSDGRGDPGYTIGPGGNFNMSPRPSRIESAYIRMVANPGGYPVDTPLKVIQSREEWSRLSLKSLISFPKYIFLDTEFPTGLVKLYPYPNASIYEIHIVCKNVFPVTVSAPTSFANYPPMTIPGMKFNLARWLRQAYGKGLRPDIELNALCQDTLDTIRAAQVQVPELIMPKMLVGTPSLYNIYGDYQY